MADPSSEARREPPRRGFVEVRWRQFRRAPRPVFRAVMSSLMVAVVLGIPLLAYDVALDRGAVLAGGDLRLLALTLYVVLVCVSGAIATWLLVPLPTGTDTTRRTRTPWSLALGLFAAVPIAYLVLVVLHELVKPVLVGGATTFALAAIIGFIGRPPSTEDATG
jgi:hypothetical protein